MDPLEQNDVMDPQGASSDLADALQDDADYNDENSNMAAEDSSAPEVNTVEEKEDETPLHGSDMVGTDGSVIIEKDEEKDQRGDAGVEIGKLKH